jgi:arginase
MKEIALIGAATGWGAGYHQTEDGPPALQAQGLADRLQEAGIEAQWRAMLRPELSWRDHPTLDRAGIRQQVARQGAALARTVETEFRAGRFPVVLGGDHAVAMGSWGGLARGLGRRPFGLIWFDAHLDAHTPATTPSQNPHGMPAAVLLGDGDPAYLDYAGGVLAPEHLVYIGTRDYEPEELAFLQRRGVRIIFIEEVRERGLATVIEEALDIVTRGTIGFGVTIDLDGFDPEDAPGIGLKCPNGLRRDEMVAAARRLGAEPGLLAAEIVEYIPEFDIAGRTATLVQSLLGSLLAGDTAQLDAPAALTLPRLQRGSLPIPQCGRGAW